MEPNAGPTQPAEAAAMPFSSAAAAAAAAAATAAAAGDWRTQLEPGARRKMANRIRENYMRCLPVSTPDGVNAIMKIAVWFEEEIYNVATSQSEYLRKISLKMLYMVRKTSQSAPINPAIPNAEAVNHNPTYQANAGPTQPMDVPAMALSSATTVGDWRTNLQPKGRLRITNKIMETLRTYLPISAPDGVNAIMKIVVQIEEEIYNVATSPRDYLQKISQKLLSMEKMTLQSAPINPAIPNAEAVNQNPTYQGITYEAVTLNRPNKRPQVSANRSIVDFDLEEDSHTKRMKVSEPVPEKVVQEEPTSSCHNCMAEKPKEITFSCPICMCVLVSPFTTICGHVFCEGCIMAATKKVKKCPTCRSKLTGRNKIHRVFLPTPD